MYNFDKEQEEYLKLVQSYSDTVDQNDFSISQICCFLDEVNIFWLKRRQIIQFKIEKITENNVCFLLSGSTYLNVSENEHYFYKSLGDLHFLPDPFEKIEPFYRLRNVNLQVNEIISLFKTTFSDTLEILSKYKSQFIFLPINKLTYFDEKELQKTFYKTTWNFLSQILKTGIDDEDRFHKTYNRYEDIEEDIKDFFLDYLLFNDQHDRDLSLRQRLNLYIANQNELFTIINGFSETEIFFISLYSLISQATDILFKCAELEISPYIRSLVPINYLSLITSIVLEQPKIKWIIENTMIFYWFHRTTEIEKITKYKFQQYCQLIKKVDILDSVRDLIIEKEIDIFSDSNQPVISLMKEIISNLDG
jgi:hypothetical protein